MNHAFEKMNKFTVIGCNESTGQVHCHHVLAENATNAFSSAAAIDSSLSMVVALPGWQNEGSELTFAGEGLVDGETVLEQTDVFGDPAYQVDESDIEHVLREYSLRVTNTDGESFATMAKGLIDEIDQGRIVRVAMAAETVEGMEQAAFDEIKTVLVEMGVLDC